MLQCVVFLHEVLIILPSFPCKALEAELDLYKGGEIDKLNCPDSLMLYLLGATQV